MKVITIKEPYATLIKNNVKLIETRSWKTSYRGKLYIHASLIKNNKINDEIKMYYNEEDLKMGYIICKCNLVDCIYMSESFINNLKKDNYIEYLCGNYEIGRYAWILKDVKVLKYPIKVKGKLVFVTMIDKI